MGTTIDKTVARQTRTCRAMVFRASRRASARLKDPWKKGEYKQDGLIEPPYHPEDLMQLVEQSNILPQCIDTMAENVCGFGYRLDPLPPEDEREALQRRMKNERERAETFLDYACYDQDLTELRKQRQRDLEVTGNAWWEIQRTEKTGRVDGFIRLKPETMRMTGEGERQRVRAPRLMAHKWEYDRSSTYYRRFRMHCQKIGDKKVWFKELGDRRRIDARTGKELTPELEAMYREKKMSIVEATEVVHWSIGYSRSPYGVPRWIGNILSVAGSRAAEEVNWHTFEHQGLGKMVVLVSGANMTKEVMDRIREFTEEKGRHRENFHKALVLEAVTESPGPGEAAAPAKIEIKELGGIDDQMFASYDKDNRTKIRSSFRLPPIYLGLSEDYSRATALESRKIAEEQVFKPARAGFDFWMNRIIWPELGYTFWKYATASAPVQDVTEQATNWLKASNAGMPLRQVIEGYASLFGISVDMDALDPAWLDLPQKLVQPLLGNSGVTGAPPEKSASPEQQLTTRAEAVLESLMRLRQAASKVGPLPWLSGYRELAKAGGNGKPVRK